MSRMDETEVLVVGAGPVGMLTALLLAEEGVEVKIIDKEWRTAAHSYGCVLHPGTLKLLGRLGLAEAAIALGRRIDTVAFYDGESRRAEMNLSKLSTEFPFALTLPQSSFEDLLEKRLRQKSGIKVLWNHRLTELRTENGSVVASIDKLAQTAKGYIVAEWDWAVQKQLETRANFIAAADGHASAVRSRLNIESENLADPEFFAVFEFETDRDAGSEVRVVLSETTNVLWPLPGKRCRWTFQLTKPQENRAFPEKERQAWRIVHQAADDNARRLLEKLAQKRAPWFKGNVSEVYWSIAIRFGRRLAKRFGQGRCWLAGDAAHQTGPVGVQSMNAGLWEAADLAGSLTKILRQNASTGLLEDYHHEHRNYWEKLLAKDGLEASASADSWVRDHCAKMLPCIPATGHDIGYLADQLKLDWPAAAVAA